MQYKVGYFFKTAVSLLINLIIYCLGVLLFAGCVSLVEKTGRVLDGTGSAEKQIAFYRIEKKEGSPADINIREVRNKAGLRSVIISLDQFPAMVLRSSVPNESGEIFLASMDYLGGNIHGWNEYRLDLYGTGNLRLNENNAVLSIPQKIEAIQIRSGRIRSYDTRITGTEALARLNSRRERILALVEWMRNREDAPKGLNNRVNFIKFWKPLLFPEMVSGKNQPEGWKRENDQWIKAEDIRWNHSYTERVFPEILREIRNSGTMLRDWEEVLSWIYIEYEWERILELLSKEIIIPKKR
ncbi:MAG: hypothetical protein LBH07_01140 [Treponema sp.]|jgi:hypothetical protein|nr:hypothetical protein [Treponema sp.]